MNVKLTIEYDGTRYHGWQFQPGKETVQEILELAAERILGVKVRMNGSGRTDAGVHASGQTANFFYPGKFELDKLQKGLNAITPEDVVIKQAESAPDSFDARWPSVFHRRFSWHLYGPLDFQAMQRAIQWLEGEHDFTSFQGSGSDSAHGIRRIYGNTLTVEDAFLVYTVEANAFLRHMVRNIVGTIVEIGRGQRQAESMPELLEVRNRTFAGPTAPPHGLFLIDVKY
jgi:tRNA pseudouridine38-40 synthase